MAQVPVSDGPSTTAQGQLQSNTIATNPNAFGANVGAALESAGKDIQSASDVEESVAKFQQALLNKAHADTQSYNFATQADAVRDHYVTNVKGGNATEDALKEVNQKLGDLRSSLGQDLNPTAKQIYDEDSRRSAFNVASQLTAHTITEQNSYTKQSMLSLMELKRNTFASDPTNPLAMQDFVDTVHKQYSIFQHMEGWDDTKTALETQREISKGMTDAIESVSVKDPFQAQQMKDVAAQADQLTGDDNRNLDKYLHAVQKPYVANDLATRAFDGTLAEGSPVKDIQASPAKAFASIVGQPVTITSGARSAEHNAAVGGVSNSLHNPTNGVAFDFVPADGNNAAAVAKLKAAGLNPKELFVDKNENGDGGFHVHVGWTANQAKATPLGKQKSYANITELDEAIAPAQQHLSAYIDKYYGGDPEVKAPAMAALDAQFGRLRMGLNAQAEASAGRMLTATMPTDSSAPVPMSFDDLKKSYPGAQNDYLSLTPSQQHGVLEQLKHNAHPTMGDMTPEQMTNAAALDGLRVSQPNVFAHIDPLTDPRFQGLPTGTKMTLMKSQAAIKAGQPSNGVEQTALKIAEPILAAKALDGSFPSIDNDNKRVDKNSSEYNAFLGSLMDNVRTYKTTYGKDPDIQHMRDMTTNLLVNDYYKQRGSAAAALLPGVPNDFVKAAQDYAASRGRQMTTAQIRAAYARQGAK